MITYWQQYKADGDTPRAGTSSAPDKTESFARAPGRLVQVERDALDSSRPAWVDARCVTRDDIEELESAFGIESENMLDFLDPDELSRIEFNDDAGYILMILRLPVFSPGDDVSYFTAPLGIILLDKFLITICWTDCEVLRDFAANRIRELSLDDFPAFTIRFMARADLMFLRYLKELNRRATVIQNEMLRSVQNRELIQLLNIQKSLVYFTTSLKSNQMLLEKLRKTKIMKLDEEDQDWIDDVEIDNKQALEMADTYTNIMSGMNDAFASVLSNNLNIVMRTMTAWSLVIMCPTFITSYFGINVPLPWAHSGWFGAVAVGVFSLLSMVLGYFFFMKRKFTSPLEPKKGFRARRLERKQQRYLKMREKIMKEKSLRDKNEDNKV